jgi:hypothetical protein
MMVLKTVAMVLGIIGGVYGLMTGLIGGGIVAALLSNASLSYSGIALFFALVPPIVGIVGAAIVRKKTLLGSTLMGISGIVLVALVIITFHLGFIFIFPTALFIAGAIVGVIGKYQS